MVFSSWKHFFSLRDWGIVAAVVTLSAFGLVAVASLHAGTGDPRLVTQAIAVGVGCALMLVIARFRSHHLRAVSVPVYAACVAAMALVLVAGSTVRGTKGWFFLGPFSLQPVEFMKLGLILMLASYFERAHAVATPWELAAKSACIALPAVGLTLLQPDAGSALILVLLWALLLVPQMPWRQRAVLAVAAAALCVGGWFFLFEDHQRERVRVLVNPARDPFGAGYNIRQSIIAVGSGRIWGRGIGAGSQSQLQFLPEASTDFSFAIIAEELGLAGALALLVAYAVLLGRMLAHMPRAPDGFAACALAGIGGWWSVQAAFYVSMNLGLAPVVGIPLPFVSYGGSALLSCFLAAGCVLAACGDSTVPRDARW